MDKCYLQHKQEIPHHLNSQTLNLNGRQHRQVQNIAVNQQSYHTLSIALSNKFMAKEHPSGVNLTNENKFQDADEQQFLVHINFLRWLHMLCADQGIICTRVNLRC